MSIEYRAVSPEEVVDWLRVCSTAFGHALPEASLESEARVAEPDRSVAAVEAGRMVGSGANFSFTLAVPGATLPAAGVTAIGVLPTHRRRGVLRGLMDRVLDDVVAREEPVAVLWASESGIYSRFGFGAATSRSDWAIETAHATFHPEVAVDTNVRLVDRGDAVALLAPTYDSIWEQRPGMLSRSEKWWEYRLETLEETERSGEGTRYYAVHDGPDGPDGYVVYRFTPGDWEHGLADSTVVVLELVAADPVAEASLWRFVLDMDLARGVEARMRPADEPLRFLLADSRRLVQRIMDGLWLRVLDVPAALTGRRYAVPGRVVLEVLDPRSSTNTGVFAIEADPEGKVTCEPTREDAPLVLSIADLGAIWLGGTRLGSLAAAGRIQVGDPGALALADAMFSWPTPPWCPEVF